MPPRDSDRPSSPLPKRLQNPLPPSPHRTTSQLSAVSVETHHHESSPRRPTRPDPSPSDAAEESLSPAVSASSPVEVPDTPSRARTGTSTPSSSRRTSLFESGLNGSTSGSGSPAIRGGVLPAALAGKTAGGGSGLRTPGGASLDEGSSGSSRKGKERMVLADEAEVEDLDVTGEMVQTGEDARKGLRELVRRSMVGESNPRTLQRHGSSQQEDIQSLETPSDRPYSGRRYYVLTNAGKPVFTSHDDSSEDNITNLMGVAQALISIFAEDDDRIKCIIKGQHRIAFALRSPLYLFCVSDWGEPEHVIRNHLDYIHLHILSIVTSTQLSRAFQRRSNFDLTRLLEGTENFLHKLIDRCQDDFSYFTSTLQPLRMAPALRDTAAAALMPPSKFKDLLYVLLIADGHIVTLLRPRKHSIHPSDLHLLLNTLASSTTLRSSEAWIPMCFPKFNPAGFVHAYVSYTLPDVGLVFVSADREAFEELRAWKEIVLEKLEKDKTLTKIEQSIPQHPYTVSALSCPGLRHFVYKSRPNVQITSPEWEAPYEPGGVARKRLVTLYHRLHDAIHARSGQSTPLKLVYIRTDHEACLAWITKPFELYLAVSPQMSKSAVVAAANTVARWVASEEGKIFLKDAPVF